MPSFGDYLVIGGVAALVTFVVTPLVARLARRVGWQAEPNDRTVHTKPVPAVGGLAMFAGFIVAIVVARVTGHFDVLFARNSEPQGVVIAACIIFGAGFIDDIRPISPPAKVTATVVAAMTLVWFGVTMYNFRVPYLDVIHLDDWVPLMTVLWLIGMTQAINLIDGLDGLAAGIVAIAAGAFFLYSNRLSELDLLTQPNLGPLLAVITAGICIGFLPHNFNPARIFMGDGGALLLGLLLAASTSVVGGRADPAEQAFVGQTYFFLAPLVLPLFILGVPILDLLFAIVRRATRRQAIASADKGHLHHRLMNLGHGHRRAVLILWTWTALLSAVVLYPVLSGRNPNYLPFGIAALGIVLYTMLHPSVRQRRVNGNGGADGATPVADGSEVAFVDAAVMTDPDAATPTQRAPDGNGTSPRPRATDLPVHGAATDADTRHE